MRHRSEVHFVKMGVNPVAQRQAILGLKMRTPTAVVAITATIILNGCASTPLDQPRHFYVSWDGDDQVADTLSRLVDDKMRVQFGFVRDFDDPIEIHVGHSIPQGGGKVRLPIAIRVVSRINGRLIAEKDRSLEDTVVSCEPEDLQPCADRVVSRVVAQSRRLESIMQRENNPRLLRANK